MNVTRELVDQIVEMVLQRLAEIETAEGRIPPKTITAVFCGGTAGAEEGRSALSELAGQGHRIQAVFTPCAEQMGCAERLKESVPGARILTSGSGISPQEIIRNTDLLLLPVLTCNSAAKLACGMVENLALSTVLRALLEGKPVLAAEDACTPAGQTFAAQMLEQNLLTLKRCGVEFVRAGELSQRAAQRLNGDTPLGQTLPQKAQRFDGKVLSVSHLRQMGAKHIQIPAGTIVTPAVWDEAKAKQIKIVRDGL